MPASRLPAPNGPNFARLAPLFLKSKNGSKNFYGLLRPISTHTERPSNFIKIMLVLLFRLIKKKMPLSNKLSAVMFLGQ